MSDPPRLPPRYDESTVRQTKKVLGVLSVFAIVVAVVLGLFLVALFAACLSFLSNFGGNK